MFLKSVQQKFKNLNVILYQIFDASIKRYITDKTESKQVKQYIYCARWTES